MYFTSSSKYRSRFLTLNSEEGELKENIIRQEIQGSAISESNYLLQKSTNPSQYSTLSTLNEIIIYDSNDNQIAEYKQPHPYRHSTASFRTVHSNLTLAGHPTKLTGHIRKNPTYK